MITFLLKNDGRAITALSFAFLMATAAFPSFAQAINVQTGTTQVVQIVLQVIGLIALAICAYLGIMAMINHSSIMPAFVSLVIGLGLIFGPMYYFQQFGVNGGAGGIANVGL